MAPLVPRFHLFEINDQEWFHPWLRRRVQAALTIAWQIKVPFLQSSSGAQLASALLLTHISRPSRWVVVDFCAGGGGPTPSIERSLNAQLKKTSPNSKPVQFVLTDLHPHVEDWAAAAARSPNIRYESEPVDASAAARGMIERHAGRGKERKKVLRLFNLAFHHFDDPLAKAILKNTVETSDGFAIFELQDRSFASFLVVSIFGLGILLLAPYFVWIWRSPMTAVFTYLIPILPFVLVFDGWVSSLRTRTTEEVEILLRTCGATGTEDWELRSGSDMHMWPIGKVHWIICCKKEQIE